MASYTQADRSLRVTTPLPPAVGLLEHRLDDGRVQNLGEYRTTTVDDQLLLIGFSGHEAISQPFEFRLQLLAPNSLAIPFEQLLGQKLTVHLKVDNDDVRHFNGICKRISQGSRDLTFTSFTMEMVPELWFLSKRAQSRIFQQKSVPEILHEVFTGLDVVTELQGTYHSRDYCVQYRETDFHFASRLMEEEGIFYFFRHGTHGHTMVVADSPQSFVDIPGEARVTFETTYDEVAGENLILSWEKTQELRSGKYTLWDHSFELPHKHLDATEPVLENVMVGTVQHKLKVGNNAQLEIYDYPGEYAQRFDGINPGGGDRSAELDKIFEDNRRTVALRMQEETMPGLEIQGTGTCRRLQSGFKILLENHFDANGRYLLTGVRHEARLDYQYRSSDENSEFVYRNSFSCIPTDLPYRPLRKTPKPVVQGTQTAVVVGPAGEEIFTDKYGRVKVQFHWDRQGQKDVNSSCWVRVGTPWAGKQWGMIHIPRIGQEVIVDFEEGDPDRPIIIGSVYNADMMPPYTLPDNKTQSGVKSRSSTGGSPENFNELRFEDLKGKEDVYFHAEKDFHRVVENDDDLKVGHDQTIAIQKDRTETVKEGNEKVTIAQGNRDVIVSKGNDTHQVKMGNRDVQIDMGNDTLTIKMGNQTTKLNMGKSETEALQSIELKVGQSSVKLDQTGVTIQGMQIQINGQVMTQVKAPITQVTADGLLTLKGALTMIG